MFHKLTYADVPPHPFKPQKCHLLMPSMDLVRIADQKFAVRGLTTFYPYSSVIPSDLGTPRGTRQGERNTISPRKLFNGAIKGARTAENITTTALGNVVSEITGRSEHRVR